MTTTTATISDFLLARLVEDEEWARAVGGAYFRSHGPAALLEEPKTPGLFSRVLAQVAAHRRIVAEHAPAAEGPFDRACGCCGEWTEYAVPWPCVTLRALASVYAGHEDYRAEWAL